MSDLSEFQPRYEGRSVQEADTCILLLSSIPIRSKHEAFVPLQVSLNAHAIRTTDLQLKLRKQSDRSHA